jgi:hypothetical protein
MKRAFLLVALLLAAVSVNAAAPSPNDFLKMNVGADRVLADYKQIASYFRALASASPRVRVETLGKTTLGEDEIMAIITSEENMHSLDRIKAGAARLADPRGLSDDEANAIIRDGKAIVLVTCNIHSTEIASSQMAMEWAYALATADDAETKRRLSNVVLLLVPSLNPDGQIMVTDWYRKYVGTRYEGGRLPWLYHHYVGHDNNRDWYMLTQVETKNLNRAVYDEWNPQVFVDEHQMGTTGPRMFIPPFADPVDPDVHPLIWREVNIIGSNMAFRLEQANKSGMIYGYSFDAYWLGGTRNTGWWKNITGLLLETASANVASPIRVEPSELRGGTKGLVDYKATINHPHPWPGGVWRIRDIMDYERIASDALLEIASQHREDLLRDLLVRARSAVAAFGKDEAYRIPHDQRDWPTAQKMASILVEHKVDVLQSDNGDYWVPLSQPYSKFVIEMLEPQRYPEVRLQPGKEILKPYDVATWTLPLAMGVTAIRSTLPAHLPSPPLKSITPETKEVLRKHAGDRQPRVAVYSPWGGALDEGWTRWLLDQYGFTNKALHAQDVKGGITGYDALILPDVSKETLATGRAGRGEEGRYEEELPPEYRGGLEKQGAEAIRSFVDNGGTLIAFSAACDYVIQEFNIPVRNALAKPGDFSVPGSLVRIHVNTNHPVTANMPSESAAFLDRPIAFETDPPGAEMQRWVLATYPDEPRDILLSGWISGEGALTRKAAAVAMTYGKGKIVLFGFRPQHRGQTHATFPMIFDALYWSTAAGK